MTTLYILGIYGLIWTGFSVSLWLLVYAWVQLARAIGRNYFRVYWFLRFILGAPIPPTPGSSATGRGGSSVVSLPRPFLIRDRDDLSCKEGNQC